MSAPDPFAADRARALAVQPAYPKGYAGLADDKALVVFAASVRRLVAEAVAKSQDPALFDAEGIDPFDRASAKAALRRTASLRAIETLIDPLQPGELKRLRGRVADAVGLPGNPLIGKVDPVAVRDDVVDTVLRIIASDIEARFPSR